MAWYEGLAKMLNAPDDLQSASIVLMIRIDILKKMEMTVK